MKDLCQQAQSRLIAPEHKGRVLGFGVPSCKTIKITRSDKIMSIYGYIKLGRHQVQNSVWLAAIKTKDDPTRVYF